MRIQSANRERWASLSLLAARHSTGAHLQEAAAGSERLLENILGFTRLTYGCTAGMPELAGLNVFGNAHVTSDQAFARFRFSDAPDISTNQYDWRQIRQLVDGGKIQAGATADAQLHTDALTTEPAFAASGAGALVLGACGLRRWREAHRRS